MTWLGAFGEGFAVLAAAGGPDVHPHAASPAEERARWDADMANFNGDLKKVERFFLDTLESRLAGDDVAKTARTFYGEQGPWYTVGWRMAVLIEKTYGRPRLIECMCDVRKLLPTYNRAAAKLNRRSAGKLALWSDSLVQRVESSKRRRQNHISAARRNYGHSGHLAPRNVTAAGTRPPTRRLSSTPKAWGGG